MTSIRDLDSFLRERVHDVADFPTAGVVFKDISPLLGDRVAFGAAIDAMVGRFGRGAIDTVVGIEARGFILGAAVAYHAAAGFVPVRKEGKLPRSTASREYALEYGTDTIEIQNDAIRKGARVVLVDDLLATGGTLAAAATLLEQVGGVVPAAACVIELTFLEGRKRLKVPVETLLKYDS